MHKLKKKKKNEEEVTKNSRIRGHLNSKTFASANKLQILWELWAGKFAECSKTIYWLYWLEWRLHLPLEKHLFSLQCHAFSKRWKDVKACVLLIFAHSWIRLPSWLERIEIVQAYHEPEGDGGWYKRNKESNQIKNTTLWISTAASWRALIGNTASRVLVGRNCLMKYIFMWWARPVTDDRYGRPRRRASRRRLREGRDGILTLF